MMKLSKKQKKQLLRILLSAAGLVILLVLNACRVLPKAWYVQAPLFLICYLPVAFGVWKKAIVNLLHGQWLDENFLMAIATVGAFVIKEFPEAVFVMLFYQVGELFEGIAVGKSRRSIATLMDIRPDEARVLREGKEVLLSPEEVLVDECLVVYPGEKIALDGVITQGEGELDTRSLTGESLPRAVHVGDSVLSGCINLGSVLQIKVTKPYGESTVSKILELVEHSTLVKSRAESAVTKFAHWYTPSVVIGAVLLAVIPSLFTGDWARWLHTALIFLVVSCPCALVISVPLSYFGGIGAASKHGVLVKGANRLEMLANADAVVFDKTGTLTQGDFFVTRVTPAKGVGEQTLLQLAASAEQFSNHPIAKSLREAVSQMPLLPVADVHEESGKGVCAQIDGKKLLVGNAALLSDAGIEFSAVESHGTAVYVARDGVFLGTVMISDRIRSDAKDAMEALKACGVRRVGMLSGDRREVAEAVAGELQLDFYRAELLPADKVAGLESLMEEGKGSLVFVGDGVNDAPVLARADVGIAMGGIGSDAAIEAADVVLMEDTPSRIAYAIRLSRFTSRIVKENIAFAIGVKLLFLVLGVLGMTNLWAATFADVGVAVIAILNAMRTLNFRVK